MPWSPSKSASLAREDEQSAGADVCESRLPLRAAAVDADVAVAAARVAHALDAARLEAVAEVAANGLALSVVGARDVARRGSACTEESKRGRQARPAEEGGNRSQHGSIHLAETVAGGK